MKLKLAFSCQFVLIILANVTLFYILTPLIASIFNLSFLWSLTLGSVLVALFIISRAFVTYKYCGISAEDRKVIEDAINHVQIYSKLLEMKVKVKVNIVSCMTVGPPTVGKTTLREQLLSDQVQLPLSIDNNVPTLNRPYIRPISTPAMDGVKKVQTSVNSNKQINRFTANYRTWRPLTSNEEFIACIKSLPFYVCQYYGTFIEAICITIGLSTIPTWVTSAVYHYFQSTNTTVSASTTNKSVSDKSISFFRYGFIMVSIVVGAMLLLQLVAYMVKHVVWVKNQYKKSAKLLKQAIKNANIEKVQALLQDTLIIHFRDSGGQPEFHEVVPALVPHSTLYLLMFNLNEDLNTQYKVTYKASEDDITDPYQSSFTVKESLLQLLASIKSIHSYSLQTRGVAVSNAFIIGTHKDLLENKETQINKITQEIKKEVKETDWYTSETLVHTPDGHLLLPIDTFNQNDIDQVKDIISKSAANRQFYIPMPWLALYFNIEKINQPVMSIPDLKRLAYDCNIDNDMEFINAFRFLENVVGCIRYFGSVPEMRDIVITDPQILFDLVTELIVKTFTFTKIRSHYQIDRFISSGRFTKQSLKVCAIVRSSILTEDQVISILQHLNIIAPVGINEEGEEEYFIPCVLVHAPISNPLIDSVVIGYTPLLVTFKCGYTPRGVFSCLISHILCNRSGQWVLASDQIYRNQVEFHLKNCGHLLRIKNCIKYLEVSITLCHGSNISKKFFVEVKELLSKSLLHVTLKLNYCLTKAGYSFGFYCSASHAASNPPHPAEFIPNADVPHTKCITNPSLTTILKPEQAMWLKGSETGPDTATSKNNFDIQDLNNILQFLSDEYYCATSWQRLGLALGIYETTLKVIECDVRSKGGGTQACLRECISVWLRQVDKVRVYGVPSWVTLAKALDAIDECYIAAVAYKNDQDNATKNIH